MVHVAVLRGGNFAIMAMFKSSRHSCLDEVMRVVVCAMI